MMMTTKVRKMEVNENETIKTKQFILLCVDCLLAENHSSSFVMPSSYLADNNDIEKEEAEWKIADMKKNDTDGNDSFKKRIVLFTFTYICIYIYLRFPFFIYWYISFTFC